MRNRVEHVVINGTAAGWAVAVGDVRTGVFEKWDDAVAYGFILVTTAAKGNDLTIETNAT